MPKRVWDKVGEAFKKDNKECEYANEYLAAVRNNWQVTQGTITRLSALLIAVAFIFELIISSKNSTVTLLGFDLSATAIVKVALPVVVAYLYYQITYSFIESGIYQSAHDRVLQEVYPAIYETNSERPLHPANALETGVDRIYYSLGTDSRATKLIYGLSVIRILVITIAPPLYVAYSYIQLFQKFGIASVEAWIGVAVSAILLTSGLINSAYLFFAEDS
jgi:hypothetical protein